MLTGKTTTMFEEWYHKKYGSKWNTVNEVINSQYRDEDLADFYHKPFSMQQGVLLEFFREQGITIIIDSAWENGIGAGFFFQIINNGTMAYDYDRIIHPDYNTALTEAIRKANELVNG